MSKFLIVLFLILSINTVAQPIFKGLTYGMSVKEAKYEFKKNNSEYTNVDLGNGFAWRLYAQNFLYDNKKLVGVVFFAKGGSLGVSHDNCISYIEFTRLVFEEKGYTVFFEPDYWQYPENFRAKYGLLLAHPDKTTMVQLVPGKSLLGTGTVYVPMMKVFNYAWFVDVFENDEKNNAQKQNNSGF